MLSLEMEMEDDEGLSDGGEEMLGLIGGEEQRGTANGTNSRRGIVVVGDNHRAPPPVARRRSPLRCSAASPSSRGFSRRSIVCLVAVLTAAIALLGRQGLLATGASRQERKHSPDDDDDDGSLPPDDGLLRYSCPDPEELSSSIGGVSSSLREWYAKPPVNMTDFLKVFRNTDFDDWGHSYEEFKAGMYDWKGRRFADLRTGDAIYESACGIGLNLHMTLEILSETAQVEGLAVYGNELVGESAALARDLMAEHPPAGGRLGTICQADSTNLGFVPADAFDLVYTGYIEPLQDPLGLNETDSYVSNCEEVTTNSDDASDDSKKKFVEQAQQRQNDWYAAWVSEMVRIAKPGAPIIVEQVSYPLCDALFDWGGVEPEFWKKAVRKYGWDVNRSSIETEVDKMFRKRYHVFMRKNPQKRL
jgi:SAM-dependent methyltransferase